MKTLTEQMIAHFNGNVTALATCWKVTRRDGEVLGFTDHDVSITIDGTKYIASSGYFRTAIANSATTAVDNLEIRGFLDHEMIGEQDLRNGLYDFAEIEIFAVNWMDLSMGICRLRYGYFGEVAVRPSGLFVVELRGLMQLFSQTVGETLSPDCRADLGDHRCKVKLTPVVRGNGAYYEEGERVIVPKRPEVASVGLKVLNTAFDWYASENYLRGSGWQAFGAVFTNYPNPPLTPVYFVRPTSSTGSIRREVPISQRNPRDGAGYVESSSLEITFSRRVLAPDWQNSVQVEFLRRHGIAGTIVDVLHTVESDWRDGLNPENAEWADLRLRVEYDPAAIPADVTHYRFSIRWRPGSSTAVGPCMIDIDWIRTDFYNDQYNSFAVPIPIDEHGVGGWIGGRSSHGNVNLLPEVGIGYAFAENQDMSQVVNLVDTDINYSDIDAGNYMISYVTNIGARDWGYRGKLMVEFRSSTNQLISTADPGWKNFVPERNWFEVQFEAPVPPLTRIIRLVYTSSLLPERVSGLRQIAVDYLNISIDHISSNTKDYKQFGGLEYLALNSGFTASERPPAFDTAFVNIQVHDGGVVWKAVPPVYTFYGKVTHVISHSEFIVEGIDAPPRWFEWGVLTFMSGQNRGRGIEVLTFWANTFRLMLPALRPIEVGTEFRVHAGCDKSRGLTGCMRFENILNYRGEPEVPGTDQYFKVGGTGADTSKRRTRRPRP